MMDTATTETGTERAMVTGIETENAMVIVEMTDAVTSVVVISMTAGSVAAVVVAVMKTTVAEITAMRNADTDMVKVEVVRKALLAVAAAAGVVVVVAAGARAGMDLVLPSAGPLRLRVRFLYPSGGAKLLDGMFMLQDMNNIRPCKPNKQVGRPSSYAIVSDYHGLRSFQPSWSEPHTSSSYPWYCRFATSDPSPDFRNGHREQPELVSAISTPIYW